MGVFIGVFSGSFFLGFAMGLVTALVSFESHLLFSSKLSLAVQKPGSGLIMSYKMQVPNCGLTRKWKGLSGGC